jgi:plasmid stabilization system protein ParE
MIQIYEIVWARVAVKDLIDIIEHISTDSPANALQVFQKIKKKALSLHTMPERCRIIPELRDQGIMQYRELVVPPWRIMFKITDMKVFVLSVIDSRRNIEDI